MQSRRDQVQAHAYIVGRLVSALVRAEPDLPESPVRRNTTGWFGGLLLAALIVAGFAIVGVIFPSGGRAWAEPGAVILEKETGTRYLYVGDVLRPVLNTASLLLLAGGSKPIKSVSAAALADVPHGQAIGILGAPDALPAPARLGGPWLVCTGQDIGATGEPQSLTGVLIGSVPDAAALADDSALLVSAAGTRYLIWRDHRLKFSADWTAAALGYAAAAPKQVPVAWLNALPPGPDIASPDVDRGGTGPVLDGRATRTGQIARVRTVNGVDYYLVAADGLTPLSAYDAALLLGDPATAAAYPGSAVTPLDLSPAEVSQVHRTAPGAHPETVPPAPPVLRTERVDVPCARYTLTGAQPTVDVVLAVPPLLGRPVVSGAGIFADTRVADRVVVRPGGGALVRPVVGDGQPGSAVYLVTDVGVKFPLGSEQALTDLGYSTADITFVPAALVALLPTGPSLDVPA